MSNLTELQRLIGTTIDNSRKEQIVQLNKDLEDQLSLKQGQLLKIYHGINKAEISIGGYTYSAVFSDSFNNQIKYSPKSKTMKDDSGLVYDNIEETINVYCINFKGTYVILGMDYGLNNNGTLTLQSGENTLLIDENGIILKGKININGVGQQAQAEDIDSLLDYLTEGLYE